MRTKFRLDLYDEYFDLRDILMALGQECNDYIFGIEFDPICSPLTKRYIHLKNILWSKSGIDSSS